MSGATGNRNRCRRRATKAKWVARRARAWARWHQLVYYAPVVVAVVGGTVGAYKGLVDDKPEIAGLAAAIAGGCSLLSAKFTKESEFALADIHWTRASGFERIEQRYDSLADGDHDPTDAEIASLEDAWSELNTPDAQ